MAKVLLQFCVWHIPRKLSGTIRVGWRIVTQSGISYIPSNMAILT